MNNREVNPFSRRATAWLVGVCVASFIAALTFAALGSDPSAVPDERATSYSRSAIGHHGFVALLERLDIPTVISRYASDLKARHGALLLIAEPRSDAEDLDELRTMVGGAARSLVVLPKRTGRARADNKAFLGTSHLIAAEDVEAVLHAAGGSGKLARPATSAAFTDNHLDLAPTLDEPQLIAPSDELEPLVASSGGVLFGKLRGRDVWILADPDLIANHGLTAGDNAALAVAMLAVARGGGGGQGDDLPPVVIDETLHGNRTTPSTWHALVEPPLVLATLAALLAIAVLLWTAMGRFGAPVPRAPAIEPGKGFLIANTAALLGVGGHAAHTLSRYLATTVQEVAQRAHAPADATPERLRAWLDQVGKARKVPIALADLETAVAASGRPAHIVATAQRIYDWRLSMTSERRS